MKFTEQSPEIPSELIRDVNDGNIVFLCGAGVSRGVGLPLFQELTDKVYARLGESQANEAAERIAYVRPADDLQRTKAKPAKAKDAAALPEKLVAELTACRTSALRNVLAQQPETALRVLPPCQALTPS
jgi:hypothetical protein